MLRAIAVLALSAAVLPVVPSAQGAVTGRTIVADVQRFWSAQMPRVYGRPYQRVPPGRVQGATRRRPPTLRCEGLTGLELFDEALEGNAIGGRCPEGPLVAWDASPNAVVEGLRARFGTPGLAAVMAHEVGHVVQAQLGLTGRKTILLEQQADCFAGAYFTWSRENGNLAAGSSKAALDDAASAMLGVRDPVGTSAGEDDAHGSGFDRVRAFQDGLIGGAKACKRYPRKLPRLFQVRFRPGEERTGGNLALGELTSAIVPELDRFFTQAEGGFTPVLLVPTATPECSAAVPATAVCRATRSVVIDRARYTRLTSRVGDASVVLLLAMAWSDMGLGGQVADPTTRYEYNVCRAGGFFRAASDGTVPQNELTLSAGDLDEALITLLSSTRDVRPAGGLASSVAFRTGVTRGVRACAELLA